VLSHRSTIFLAVAALLAPASGCGDDASGETAPDGRPIGKDRTITLFEGEHLYLAGDDHRIADAEVELPDAEPLYQQVTLEVTLACPNDRCDRWSRIGWLALLDDSDREIEIARFATPYRVGGSWLVDVTDLMPLLRGRQTIRLFIDTEVGPGDDDGDGWLVDATLSYTGGVPNPEPYQVIPVWSPQPFAYGDPAQPTARTATVDIPADAGEVAFRGIVTGHGVGSADNCAEFCEREHWIEAGGDRRSRTIWRDDCRDTAVPDQDGTWTLDRAGWCPGASVRYWFDLVTPLVTPGAPLELTYDVEPYENSCRPDAPDCTGCLTTGCDYDELHTEPRFYLSGVLVLLR
jgi:hypothetical protein